MQGLWTDITRLFATPEYVCHSSRAGPLDPQYPPLPTRDESVTSVCPVRSTVCSVGHIRFLAQLDSCPQMEPFLARILGMHVPAVDAARANQGVHVAQAATE